MEWPCYLCMIKKLNLLGSSVVLVSYFGIFPEPNSLFGLAAFLFFVGIAINTIGLAGQKPSGLAIFYVVFMAAIFFPGIGTSIHILPAIAAFLPLLLALSANPNKREIIERCGSPF